MYTKSAKNPIMIKVIFCFVFVFTASFSYADLDTQDIFASVVVLPTFDVKTDTNYLDFGVIEPGESVTLKENTYYNEVTCVSNKGVKYYLKANLLGDIKGPEGTTIPPSSVKWKIFRVKGEGTITSEDWQPFAKEPAVVYTSNFGDEAGGEVTIKLQYRLDLPSNAMGGNYNLQVAYIMTEVE